MQDLLAQARGQLRHQPTEKRVRASLDGEPVVESTRAILVSRTSGSPAILVIRSIASMSDRAHDR